MSDLSKRIAMLEYRMDGYDQRRIRDFRRRGWTWKDIHQQVMPYHSYRKVRLLGEGTPNG